MILPYLLRLLCLCFSSFFVLNAALGLLVRVSSRSAIRVAGSKTPVAAARFLLALRMFPFTLAALFVLGLCVPSYLWLEPAATAERVGLVCVILGMLGALAWALSLVRGAHSIFVSLRHDRLSGRAGFETRILGNSSELIVFENESPVLAVSGLLRPRLLISRNVLGALSAEELDAALSHERAHHASRDNVKRLLLLLVPDVFPFVRPFRPLESAWAKFAEWAADDQAAAGDSRRALSLAAALVNVARMGSSPRLPFLSTSLVPCDRDLFARVDRLLHPAPVFPARAWPARRSSRIIALLLLGSAVFLLAAPATLSFVHELLEILLH
ncbi:MAG: M56 family metallopeptidase [Candidatus Acidiferrum sp.]